MKDDLGRNGIKQDVKKEKEIQRRSGGVKRGMGLGRWGLALRRGLILRGGASAAEVPGAIGGY